MTKNYDTVIIGGGTGGYIAAIKLSQLGQEVAVVEKEHLGGTCLNKGCIPTKSFLKSAEVINTMKHAYMYGIDAAEPSFNIKNIVERKNTVVNKMQNGIKYLMDKNKIDIYNGTATVLGPSLFSPLAGAVSVSYEDEDKESEILVNDFVIIASGSKPAALPFMPFDGKVILSSDDLMDLEHIPEKIAIVGGGVIGVEFATVLSAFGTDVTIIEAAAQILPTEDKDVAQAVAKSLAESGVTVKTGVKLNAEDTDIKDDGISITLDGQAEYFNHAVVAIGRKANTEDLGLQNTKVKVNNGIVEVNEYQQTNESHIYAVGDVTASYQLAHVAIEEALIAAEHITDHQPLEMNYDNVPRCIYTSPEVASIGPTTEQLKADKIEFKTHKLPLSSIAKAVIDNDGTGFIKMNIAPNGDILSASIVGAHATELINQLSLAKFMDASALELSSAVFAHPSVGEIIKEIGLDAEGIAIHV
ncbi:Dihydrolipoyl dehydrogenase [Jeotgalicoccus aerolatus]|uniref:Dihydrolipoyl dehydrogenase n=1 Tax=Jeotgalicoccus aerolatus TaxID=709510 RepID=A0ABS4HMZ6_9STAP|nr:dihydrolipoyl dehydrogenase [Jeotgalicoccus aerolatus]MBP1951752.1 dihydrolipoamide dehydrogenase [Jeotgalicoccus aerolatus]GGD95033.1 dihydrolipoyl dehydrogenase [Jeotgalicoccus aerolatus]CAD2075377.1 Dihydrolipoyl dehydrogenase [Jeotgalicoccus aerolatus]